LLVGKPAAIQINVLRIGAFLGPFGSNFLPTRQTN